MSIRVAIHHKTEYLYDRLVALAPHLIRLRPAPHTRTPFYRYSLKIEPEEHFINWQQDPFGNFVARLVFPERTRKLSVEVDVIADMVTINPFDFFVEPYADEYPFVYEPQLARELKPYFERREQGRELAGYLSGIPRGPRHVVDFLVDVNRELQQRVGYVVRMEPGVQTCEETLETAKGSCRDSAWLLVQILRHLGLAARFVSGYLVQLAPDVKSLDGPSGPEHDFTDLHAWAEVFVPGAGWLGLDPTSGLFAGEGHIPLACTPDPVSAAPVTGAVDECEQELVFENTVTRIHEDPRVTKPYSDRQWSAVMALGDDLDRQLEAADVRLMMGGEPTFVSIDDMDGAEWNRGAFAEHQRERAGELLRSLWKRFAPGGVLHYGQGKWYPGEPLPRWALSCFWRADAKPVWREPELLADPERPQQAATADNAEAFAGRLAEYLGIAGDCVVPGYEPPQDERLLRLSVTPDPGVIEVNVHPAASWRDLVGNGEILYEEARLARLGTEKFMLDGRHTGTGGGNHVTIGGPTPGDSPILRRPQVLSSLLTFWQHHPSLSYLFSGLFVGPTSQAPRVDEARDDSLYELEIALQQLPGGDQAAPWLVDRVLRNLLVDMTGNTHRSEFCIDKLYSPDSPTGRRGLVEFRAFEMPPHHRMSVVQMLLLRALIARFWEHPYTLDLRYAPKPR